MDGNGREEDTGDDSLRFEKRVNKLGTSTSAVLKDHNADVPGALLDSIAIIFALSSSSDESSGDGDVGNEFKKDYPADILFSWPKKSKSKTVGALLECQGMFTTLFRLLQDVMWSVPSVSHVRVNENDTDVCYASDKEGAGLLLVAFGPTDPAHRIPVSVLQRFTNKLFTAITFKYGSLTRAFRNAVENETGRLLSNAVSSFLNHPAECFLSVETLTCVRSLPVDIIQQIEEIMYTLETKNSADEDDEVYSTGNESLTNFYCLGSLVLCKGALVASHLEEKLQQQLCSWIATELNHLDLIENSTASEQVVKWQPVHINCHDDLHEDHNCPHYAVLVGLEGLLLIFLLESVQILRRVLPQDDLWMKAGMEAAMQLLCLNISEHVLKVRNVEGEGNKSPSQSNKGYNSIQKSLKNRASQDMLNKAEQDPQFNSDEFELSADLKQSLQSLTDKLSSISDRKDGHGDSGTTTGSDASSSKLSMDGSETVSSHRGNFLSSHVLRQSIPTNVIMRENCVYCFLMVDYGRGVLVAHEEEAHHISHQLMTNFRLHARTTHEILRKAKNSRETLSRRAGNHRWASKAIAPVTEHGTLFTCSPPDPPGQRYKKKAKKINYWVVGRLYDEHREVFVCLQDTVANESVREIAFKMALSDGNEASV